MVLNRVERALNCSSNMDFSVTKSESHSERTGNATKEKWYYFPAQRKFISKHIYLRLSTHYADELFWRWPSSGKTQGEGRSLL